MSDDFKLPDIGNLMQVAQKMQGDVAKLQEELGNKTCEASAGGGMVTAVINGRYELVTLKIEQDAVDPGDVAMLQDLVMAAVNQALAKVRDVTQDEMGKITGGLNIPGMPKLF